ncbi:hypothetical protein NL676_029457 [Syzygium grande]|nr:hypothetical protein NL676_029457 [Syzygium grande]
MKLSGKTPFSCISQHPIKASSQSPTPQRDPKVQQKQKSPREIHSKVRSLKGTTGLDTRLTASSLDELDESAPAPARRGHRSSTCGMAASPQLASPGDCGCRDGVQSGMESRGGGDEGNRKTIGSGGTEGTERGR